jgi:hypothetical protein
VPPHRAEHACRGIIPSIAVVVHAWAMLAVTCKVRRSSYQPLCLKMSRKKPPNPRSKPRPRAVFIKDSRKNTAESPAQTSASEPGKPWYCARRQATGRAGRRPTVPRTRPEFQADGRSSLRLLTGRGALTDSSPLTSIKKYGQSLEASRSVFPTARFSFAAQTQLGLRNDLRFQARQNIHDFAVAPHASRQALLGLGSDDMWHAEQIHDPLEYWSDDRKILIAA